MDDRQNPQELERVAAILDRVDRGEPLSIEEEALVAAYAGFLDASAPAGANVPAAESAMAAALQRELEREIAPTSGAPAQVEPRSGPGFRWWSLRPLAGFAVVLLALGTVYVMQRDGGLGTSGVLRGQGEDAFGAIAAPALLAGGDREFRWDPVAGADGYELRLYTPSMEEVGRYAADGSVVRLSSGQVDAIDGARVLWKIVALRGGRDWQVSRVATLELR